MTSNNGKKILQITKYKIIHVYEIRNILSTVDGGDCT